MRSDRQRLAELEMRVEELQRTVNALTGRQANRMHVKLGWWFCKLLGTLTQGGTVQVELIHWNNGNWESSGITLTARDFYLNEGESVEADTNGEVAWYRNTWVVRMAYCAVSDTLPEDSEEDELQQGTAGGGGSGGQSGGTAGGAGGGNSGPATHFDGFSLLTVGAADGTAGPPDAPLYISDDFTEGT